MTGRMGLSERDSALAWEALHRGYESPGRHYHTLGHVTAVLEALDEVEEPELSEEDRETLEAALWFHDLVYDPRASDNEARSAAEAECWLRKGMWGDERIRKVVRLILATRHEEIPDGEVERLMVDLDLAVLGSERDDYEAYARAIRCEYVHVPEPIYRRERARVLRSFLDRPAIYSTAGGRARYEKRARENLSREIESLSP